MFLQETRAIMKNTPAYVVVSRCRDIALRRGGVVIGIDRILTYRDLGHLLRAHLNKTLEMVFVQIVHE
jgi:hypothetical protein